MINEHCFDFCQLDDWVNMIIAFIVRNCFILRSTWTFHRNIFEWWNAILIISHKRVASPLRFYWIWNGELSNYHHYWEYLSHFFVRFALIHFITSTTKLNFLQKTAIITKCNDPYRKSVYYKNSLIIGSDIFHLHVCVCVCVCIHTQTNKSIYKFSRI